MSTMNLPSWLASRGRFLPLGIAIDPIEDPPKSYRRFRLFVLEEASTTVTREKRLRGLNGTGARTEVSRESHPVHHQPHIGAKPVDNRLQVEECLCGHACELRRFARASQAGRISN